MVASRRVEDGKGMRIGEITVREDWFALKATPIHSYYVRNI